MVYKPTGVISPSLSISNIPKHIMTATCLELYDSRGLYVLRLGWLSEVGLSTIVPPFHP